MSGHVYHCHKSILRPCFSLSEVTQHNNWTTLSKCLDVRYCTRHCHAILI
uniref:Uncharacterized protein n=1 Tax=Anguilla anguilla TaxID=7936 RepID=A0A0E9SUL5_ANGAN